MTQEQPTAWGIRAGRAGQADPLFRTGNVVALGWDKVGDLSDLPDDREPFKQRLRDAYPDMKKGAIPVSAGQLYRFIHEAKVADVVLYPCKSDRQIHIGRVTGEYEYRAEPYPHRRAVEWVRAVPRSDFSQGALYEIGSALSFFQVRNFADEFLAAMKGRPPQRLAGEDVTIEYVASAIEENTRDFVLKQLARELKGHPFAELVAHLLELMGYRTRVSAPGPDKGVDILAHRDELGFEPPLIKVQVKSTEGTVGDPETSALFGKVGTDEFGLLVTLGSFSSQARNFADGKSNLRLIDGDELVELILNHYEQLDSRYKGLIPLKRVYVPESIEEAEEQ